MQSRLWISGVLLALSVSVQTAAAGPQEDVAAAGQKWATVFAENNPDAMLPFYAKDAVLWGTLSPTVRSDPAAVKAYFVGAFQALPKATVKFGDQLIRVFGNTAVNTGYYTFSYTKDGETKSIPARYSFTYVKDGNDWKSVDHHSSAVPAPPTSRAYVKRGRQSGFARRRGDVPFASGDVASSGSRHGGDTSPAGGVGSAKCDIACRGRSESCPASPHR